MAINKVLVILFELLIAVGAILFMIGFMEGLGWTMPVSSEFGTMVGSLLILVGGFALAFYISYAPKCDGECKKADSKQPINLK